MENNWINQLSDSDKQTKTNTTNVYGDEKQKV